MSENSLLILLSDGDYHSGEELGQAMGISRTAVWKQVNKLSELGVSIHSVKSKGYRIEGGLDLLHEEKLREQFSQNSIEQCSQLIVERSIPSTNGYVKEQAEIANATGLAILAEQQTAGRGRRGRTWVSPFGCNVYLSVAWGFDSGIEAIEGLSLAVGVSVCRALKRCGIEGVQLKWPNDLLWGQRKVGGILLEVVGDPTGFCQVVIGIGLNVGMDNKASAGIDQAWANIDEVAGKKVARNVLAGSVLDELFSLLKDYEQVGFLSYQEEWQAHDAYADQPVRLSMVSKQVEGVARGVSGSGALQLEVDGDLLEFSGGEISMRAQK